MIIRVARYVSAGVESDGSPCEGAVVRYGEWERARVQVYTSVSWGGLGVKTKVWGGREIIENVLETPDTDSKRNAVLDGDWVTWERRDKWWEIEVNTLEELIAVVDDGGRFYADNGQAYIEFED